MGGNLRIFYEIIERLVKSGTFGEHFYFVDLVQSDVEGEDHFASDVVFAEIQLQNGLRSKNISVIIKRQQEDEFLREVMNTSVQFYNEVVMYKDILPFLEQNDILKQIFPTLFYGCATLNEDYENDCMILEDLRPCGFRLTKEKLFLDFEHCALALTKLGHFHAVSYSIKENNFEEFSKKIGKLKEARTERDEEGNRFLIVAMERGVLPLIEEGEHVDVLKQFLEKIQDPYKFEQGFFLPEEPIAVLCHGDFCRNNMLFKYDETGKPVDVRFFDVATSRYASPAIDLCFFLFMNTSTELRNTRWEDLLEVYHKALSSAIPDCSVPSLDTIRSEVSRKAAYGYYHSSFFIPMMMEFEGKGMEKLAECTSRTPEELDEMNRNRGGEQATKYITDIVRDLLKLNSL